MGMTKNRTDATTWNNEDFDEFFADRACILDAKMALNDEGLGAYAVAEDHARLRNTIAVLMLLGRVSKDDVDDAMRIVDALR